mgnify:CR=1 FL=1
MCPSYMVTRDERDVTRGRANALRLAITGQLGRDALTSEDMAQSLKLCVSCKACRNECPTGVDMAKMKIEFLHQWQRKHGLARHVPGGERAGLLPERHAAVVGKQRRLAHDHFDRLAAMKAGIAGHPDHIVVGRHIDHECIGDQLEPGGVMQVVGGVDLGGHVQRRAIGFLRHDLLCRRDPGIAGSEDLGDLGYRGRAVCHRRDGLRATYMLLDEVKGLLLQKIGELDE